MSRVEQSKNVLRQYFGAKTLFNFFNSVLIQTKTAHNFWNFRSVYNKKCPSAKIEFFSTSNGMVQCEDGRLNNKVQVALNLVFVIALGREKKVMG